MADPVIIDDPAELKLIEKFREILGKGQREGDPAITREFTIPDLLDSDVKRHISIGVRKSSEVVQSSRVETRVERAKVPEKFRSDLEDAADYKSF